MSWIIRIPHPSSAPRITSPTPRPWQGNPLPLQPGILTIAEPPGLALYHSKGIFFWMLSSLSDSHVPRSCSLSSGTFCCCSLWSSLILFFSLGNVSMRGLRLEKAPCSERGWLCRSSFRDLCQEFSETPDKTKQREMLRAVLIKLQNLQRNH